MAEVVDPDAGRAPGPQQPENYPFVGAAYHRFGEQPGFRYNPYRDRYEVDQQELAKIRGQPQPPGLGSQVGTVAALLGASALAKEGGKALPGLFGLGGSGAAASGAAAPVAGAAGAGSAALGGSTAGAATGAGSAAATGGATAAAEGGGLFGIGALPVAGIAAGTYLGGKSLYDLLRGNKDNSVQGKIGRGLLGVATGGLSEVARHFLGDQDKFKTESRSLNKLSENGTFIPQNLLDFAASIKKGRSDEELIAAAQKDGGNVEFAKTRNESSLTPTDIVNYSAFAANDPDWFNKPLDQRLATAKQALDAGAVREHHGTIDIDWAKVNPPQQDQPTVSNQPINRY